jgi:hypothetical protein
VIVDYTPPTALEDQPWAAVKRRYAPTAPEVQP